MLTIPASVLCDVRRLFKRFFAIRGDDHQLPVQFLAAGSSLVIRAVYRDAAVSYTLPGEFPETDLTIPLPELAPCCTSRKGRVRIIPGEGEAETCRLEWQPAGVPREADATTIDDSPLVFPACPLRMASQPAGFPDALREATRTASDESSRYALGCLQFRGERQQLVATDGLELLIQRGFEFPWKEDLLAEKNAVFSGKEFLGAKETAIGRTEDHIVVGLDRWRFWLPLDKQSRFPRVEGCMPNYGSEICRVEFAPHDRDHLLEALPHLPGRKDGHVTLELNGRVTVSAKNPHEAPPTAFSLDASRTTGTPIRVTLKRSMIARALRLGFDHLCFQDHDAPAFCTSERTSYVCAIFAGTTRLDESDESPPAAEPAETAAA